ncbi:PREDICTED: uncharacterized protein LOC109236426 [Nicotiana attenuata]|uniref:uncharacterized protein LOC109236426 n=1 Tax=Nicotiana attenuata TaxID=49451 RepID=UPI0009048827|nr:PREDICTED: uncharacterized protein LOC109236426 [Nicotiana attenuata]
MVIKLDMAKAYDRVSWCGFFHSTRGLKQGDPLAPALFILGAELLSRMLNNLTHDQFFNGFYMEKRGPQVTHLSFADDIIIFTSGRRASLQKIMNILEGYEQTSGQLINKNKSHFMTSPSAFPYTIRRNQQITGFSRKDSPLTYLGCPLYTGRKRIIHFNSISSKVIVKLVANFFWGMDQNKNKYHWASWKKLAIPQDEGGIGNSSFWWDNWLGIGHLASFRIQGGRPGNIQVSHFWDSGSWDIQKLNNIALAHMIPEILQIPISYNPQVLDKPIWKPTATGNFTCSSAWNVVRRSGPKLFINRKIWHKKIPFEWSFCLWRALRNKLPTDDRVAKFGPPTVNRYVCCLGPQAESVDHIFSREMPLSTLLTKWWRNKDNNEVHKLLIDTLPIVVIWQKPNKGTVKVNSDGSALTNPGKMGAGAMIRDDHGDFIYAIASPLGEGSNNLAETEAAILGLNWCVNNGFTKIHLEADSALLIHWLTTDATPPWTLTIAIQKLRHLCHQCETITYTHAYREANTPADSLSKLSHNLPAITHYPNLNELPSQIRGQIHLDKLAIPAFRHKLTRKLINPTMVVPSSSNNSNAHV